MPEPSNPLEPGSPEEVKPKVVKPKKDKREKLFTQEFPLVLTASPHDMNVASTPKIMWSVTAALVPSVAMGLYYFRWQALWLVLVCVGCALLSEAAVNGLRKLPFTIGDGSAALTGLLLALTLPPGLSLVSAGLGSVFAIVIGKQIFGGLGYNIFNPALLGRAFLQASFPVALTTWVFPHTAKYAGIDGLGAATPLGLLKFEQTSTSYLDLLVGNIGGSVGETSALAILAGGIFLLIKRYADWRIVVSFLGSTAAFGGLVWLFNPTGYPDPLFHLLSGGALFGAFFMATDMVTSPVNPIGSWIFGCGCGVLLVVIRVFGGLPEGVMYSILLMNGVTPLINRYTRPKYMGEL